MQFITTLKNNVKSLFIFSLPIIIGQLGQIFIGAGDIYIAANHSSSTVAAISIANAIIMTIFIFGFGLLLSISPVLSNRIGKGISARKLLKLSLIYSLVLAAVFCGVSLVSIPFIPLMGVEKTLIPHIQEYIFICSFSFFGAYVYQALKEFLQAYERVFFPNMVSVAAIFVNLLLNAVLVFGIGFMPELGVRGLAISSLLVRSLMGLVMLIHCYKFFREKFIFDKKYIYQLLKVGYPVSLALFLEFFAFNVITLIIAGISSIQVAVHNIVSTLISITFMVPLAISSALGVRIGYAFGAKDYKKIKEHIFSGLILSAGMMGIAALAFFTFPKFIISIFSTDPEILAIGSGLLYIAGMFQLFDGIQVALGGILKGFGMTKPVFYAMFLAYWLIGIPAGYILAFIFKLEITGFWIGLALALSSCAMILTFILRKKLAKIKVSWNPSNTTFS